MPNLRAATDKRAAYVQDRLRAIAQALKFIMRILKARFVEGGRIEHGGFSYLEDLVGESVIVSAFS